MNNEMRAINLVVLTRVGSVATTRWERIKLALAAVDYYLRWIAIVEPFAAVHSLTEQRTAIWIELSIEETSHHERYWNNWRRLVKSTRCWSVRKRHWTKRVGKIHWKKRAHANNMAVSNDTRVDSNLVIRRCPRATGKHCGSCVDNCFALTIDKRPSK